MPLYEYKCRRCDHTFDVLQRLGENGETLKCPNCGENKPEKVFSAFASTQAGGGSYTPPSSSCSFG